MMIIFWLIFVAILFILLMVLLWRGRPPVEKKTYRTVKAGNVESAYAYPATIDKKNIIKNKKLVANGQLINPDNYEIFIVTGDSMSTNKIKDGDAVIVDRLFGNCKYEITGTPVLIFEIDLNKDDVRNSPVPPVEFKLRKFMTYVDCSVPFDDWFNPLAKDYPDLVDNKLFVKEKFDKCIDKYKIHNPDSEIVKLIMSSTLNTEKGKICYSFHPIKFLYGKVNYVIPAKELE